jgi:phosphoglycolate phosphatase-like HAD superfamily hydrolase
MSDAAQPLKDFKKEQDFLVGIDSDGCVFDTMEIKQKECFIPNTCKYFDLQSVAKYAREAGEFVNLYSKWRGVNRFPALIKIFELLEERAEVKARGLKLDDYSSLKAWVAAESKLGNPALEKYVAETGDPFLTKTLAWSKAVNATVADIVYGVPPFPLVRESLAKMRKVADTLVVSQTPGEALVREWQEHNIDDMVKVIAGQEMGTKTQHLGYVIEGRYAKDHVLMIGDAPGDLKAARANGVLFYPINPGNEEASWKRFYEESFDKFIGGTYAGDYEAALIDEFEAYLPEKAPWQIKQGGK